MMRRLSVLLLALVAVLASAVVALTPAQATGEPSVSLTKDKPYYTAGQRETLTVTSSNAGSGKAVVLTLVFPNSTEKGLCASDVSDPVSDTQSCGVVGYVNHQVRADLYDTASKTIIASTTISVAEIASLSTTAKSGFLGYSGSYAVYAKGAKPVFRSYDSTGKVATRCLRHEVQRRYSAGWKPVFTSACRAETSSHVDWKWLGKHPSKVKFRVRATFAGDAWNKPGHGAWRYFRFR